MVVAGALLLLLDLVTPRSKRKILLYSKGGLFFDNPKYLFLHLLDCPEWRPMWVSLHAGESQELCRAYGDERVVQASGFAGKLKLVYHVLTASVLVIRGQGDLWVLRKYLTPFRRVVVDLCHGVPIKKTGVLIPFRTKAALRRELRQRRTVTYHTVSSDIERYFLSASYSTDVRRFPITGDPRNDRLMELRGSEPQLRDKIRMLVDVQVPFSRVILYAPTHRDGNALGTSEITTPQFFPFPDFEPHQLQDLLERTHSILLLRTHNEDNIFGGDRKGVNDFVLDNPRVHYFSHAVLPDINEILPAVDQLWTDYSGIYLDFLLCDKPITFIPYDKEDYERHVRGFLFEYELFTPGPHVRDWRSLSQAVERQFADPEWYSDERDYVRRVFHKYLNGGASERVAALLSAHHAG